MTPQFDLEWTTACLTMVTSVLFVAVGLMVRRQAASRSPVRGEGRGRASLFILRTRRSQLVAFGRMAKELLADAQGLRADNRPPGELRTLTPLVSEVRQRGECLLKMRERRLWFWTCSQEKSLVPLVGELTSLEKALKSLPRSKLTVEDVLAGRFELENPSDKGV